MVPAVAALLVKALMLHANTLEHNVICFKASVRMVLFLSFLLALNDYKIGTSQEVGK